MKILTLNNRFNIPAFIAGVIMLYILYSDSPWWFLKAVGEKPTFEAYIAPYHIQIFILGKPIEAPIIYYAVLSGYLIYLLTGLLCILGSFYPGKGWSKSLVGYKGLIIPLATIITIYISLYAIRSYMNIDILLIGKGIIRFNLSYDSNIIRTSTEYVAGFTYTFYLALIAGVLSLIGRLSIKTE